MLSLHALKYKVTISSSYYAGMVVFLLYFLLLLLSLLVIKLTIITSLFYLFLLGIASFAARKIFLQQDEILLSESGLVERKIGGNCYNGKISASSFYNGLFISLHLSMRDSLISAKQTTQYMTIYKDAVSEEHYRLLARLIKAERD